MWRSWGFVVAAALLAIEALLTQKQITLWKDAPALWHHQLYYQPKLILAWANLGTYYHREKDYVRAMGYDQIALYYGHLPGRMAPYEYSTICGVHYNYVSALLTMNRPAEASAAWDAAVRTNCLNILKPGPHDLG